MRSLSLLSSLKAIFCAFVRLGLGGWEDLRTLLTSALSSSASCWLSLVQAASMAVIYSKLGGCLGVTAKLGPLARTDLCAGVKGLLERLMTHLGLGSSLEEPWLDLWGGCEGGGPSLEVAQASGEGWVGWSLVGRLVPCLFALGGGGVMPCLGCPLGVIGGLGRIVFFPCSTGPGLRGWGGELLASEWSCAAPGGELLPSPGGRWAIAGVWMWEGAWLIVWLFAWFRSWGGELLASEGSCTAPGGELLPSPGGRWAIASVGRWGGPD